MEGLKGLTNVSLEELFYKKNNLSKLFDLQHVFKQYKEKSLI